MIKLIDILKEVEITPLDRLKSELQTMATSWNKDQKAVAILILGLDGVAKKRFQKSYNGLEYPEKIECLQQAKESITDLDSIVNQIDKLIPSLKGMQNRIAASLWNKYKDRAQPKAESKEPLAEAKKEEPKIGAFEDFAETRGKGADKIAKTAKEKGGLALLTYNHFKVKAPYYKKAAEGKFDIEEAKKEYESVYKSISLTMTQTEFQKAVGKLEVLGELIIRDK